MRYKPVSDARVASVANLMVELDNYQTALDTAKFNKTIPDGPRPPKFGQAFWARVVDELQRRWHKQGAVMITIDGRN
jgi:hypothetical protein